MSLNKIPIPDLQSIQSMSNPQSPQITESSEISQHPTSHSKDSILPPSNLTDIESIDDYNASLKPNRNTSVSSNNHHSQMTSSSAYDSNSEINHYPSDQENHPLLLSNSNNSSREAIPVKIKLSQLPNTSSSSLLISRNAPRQKSVQLSPVSTKLINVLGRDKSNNEPEIEVTAEPISSSSSSAVGQVPSSFPHKRNKSLTTPQAFTPPPIPNFESPNFSHKKRESTMSNFSHYSGMIAEYDAVPMTVKRSSISNIKYIDGNSKSRSADTTRSSERELIDSSRELGNSTHDDDITDEEDQSSIVLGKLPTTSIHSSDDSDAHKKITNPDKSFTTNIEGSIPARSPRRPTSMVASNFNIDDIYQQQQQQHQEEERDREHQKARSLPEHNEGIRDVSGVQDGRRQSFVDDNKRRSIQINDGLEKLMLDASSLNSEPDLPNHQQDEEDPRGIASPGSTYIGKAYGITYTDTNSEEVTSKYDPITNDPLDKISSHDNDTKSLRSSSSVRTTQSNLPPRPKPDDIIKARKISSNLQQQEQLKRQQRQYSGNLDHESSKLREIQAPNNDNRNHSIQDYKSHDVNIYNDQNDDSRIISENIRTREVPRGKVQDFKNKHRTGIIGDIDSDFNTSPQNPQFPLHHHQSQSGHLENNTAFQQEHQPQHQKNIIVDDEGYYDIDEPILMKQPSSRAKSVKKSIKRPSGSTRRKKKTTKGTKNSNSDLRPFNYSTLISLLESMNGTIIGEEFNNLDIPIKEKQLIEKIIDSLSRLTSDMIIDQTRYDVGIERLEKCLRALEGFL